MGLRKVLLIGGLAFAAIFIVLAMTQIQTTQEAQIATTAGYSEVVNGTLTFTPLSYGNITNGSEVVTYNFDA